MPRVVQDLAFSKVKDLKRPRGAMTTEKENKRNTEIVAMTAIMNDLMDRSNNRPKRPVTIVPGGEVETFVLPDGSKGQYISYMPK